MSHLESTETGIYPELEGSVHFQLWRATNRWQRELRRALDASGLTYVQFMVLAVTRFLSLRHPHVSQAMVARTADMDEMMVSQVVRVLEQRGLIGRQCHPQDARARCLRLTADGEALVMSGKECALAATERLIEPIADRRQELIELLRAIATAPEGPASD